MKVSERFLNLVRQQLISYEADPAVEHLVVYIAQSNDGESPSLEAIGQWPVLKKALQPLEADRELRAPSPNRRWYPLQEGDILLGVLRVERYSTSKEWPESLDRRLQASAIALGNSLGLELEREKLINELTQQREQIGLIVHQLRNPLAALRTYAKLLLKKLGPESDYTTLIQSMLNEQEQLNKYVSVIDELSQIKLPASGNISPRLLLPPVLAKEKSVNLRILLEPLIERSAATANLQGRNWIGPVEWPDWVSQPRSIDEGGIAEIIANLLENAFRYSSKNVPIGLHLNSKGICVWDGGNPINEDERKKIFDKGFRGKSSSDIPGSGLGLALGFNLALKLGGELKLIKSPFEFDPKLPSYGNAFVLSLPKKLLQPKEE
tara:strand:+ start:2387 stop:3523 length:1137 start_codon:yes stop_codon:yes gene_type:complete